MRMAPSCVSRRPASARKRFFTGSSSAAVAARSKRNCTAEATLLTFWPPGPAARTKENSTSPSAIARLGVTAMGMGLQPGGFSARRTAQPLPSGVQIRNQLAFEARDLVFEDQLAFLQTLQLQLVDMKIEREASDDLVEVPVLDAQLAQLLHAPKELAVDVIFCVHHSRDEGSRPRPQVHAAIMIPERAVRNSSASLNVPGAYRKIPRVSGR